MRNVYLFIAIITTLSCVTNHDYKYQPQTKTLNEAILHEIDENFKNDELFKVFQLVSYYEDQNRDNHFLINSKEKLNKLLPLKLRSHYENKEWNEFFTTYKNLKVLDYDLAEYDYNDILYNYIAEYLDESLLKSGVYLGESALEYDLLNNEQLITLYNLYESISPKKDYPRLLNELNLRSITINSDSVNNNYLDGVFTVFVNKGLTFNNGIGTSDIVVGSGFFIDKKGHAITNYHVIESQVDPEYEGISHLYVRLNGSVDKVPAKVVGWDKVLDLALLKVSTIPDYVYSLSTDEDIFVGDTVIALGSPGGLGSTVTSGIVSAKDRTLLELGSVIQIDSPINPGNSGGPLINTNKEVTNIVFAGIEQFEGINFAIPAKYLKKKIQSLYSGGAVNHVWIGAGISYRKNRLEVIYIKPDSPSYFLGLKKGDIIHSINGTEFKSIIEIQDYLMDFKPLEIIDLKYIRDDKTFSKSICLEERPKIPMESILDGDTSDHLYTPLFGMDIRYTGKILWNKEYQIEDVYPGTIADELELTSGDFIEVKNWQYNKEYNVVLLQLIVQSKSEGFWKKVIQISSPINVNFFI